MIQKYLMKIFLLLSSVFSFAQTTYDFTTDATLSGAGGGWPWNTTADITIGGIAYRMTSGGNGSFSNVGSGGESNSKALRKDGSGGDSFTLQRADGQPFQFYGIWVNMQGLNSYSTIPGITLPPWYTLTAGSFTYQDMTPMTAGTAWNNYTYSSTSISSGAGGVNVTSVSINFPGINYYVIDNIVVGTAVVLNDPPTNIALSASSINENVAANSTIGTLSTTDPNSGNTFTYTLVSGTGDTHNTAFNISGNNLRITNSPNFETQANYSIRVRTTDQGGLTYEKSFAITINNQNETPTDIALTANSINENVLANTPVGVFSSTDVDAANTFTYTLVAGTGSTDNASFNISGNSLRITNSPDFETKSSYAIRVRTTDQGSLTFEKQFTITINNLNEAPTDISLSATAINENVAANSTVGTLSSSDVDAANTFTYTLVAGTGSTDNASFNISGNSLRITNSPDFETKSSYAIRVRTTDQGSLTFEKQFTITINNLNEAPTDISLSATAINENVAANSTVGTLSSSDVDAANTFTYTLVAGTGSTDNGSFNISGNSLRITNSPDFETKSSYAIRVRTTDQGSLFFEKQFTITINNLTETPATHLDFDGVNDVVNCGTTLNAVIDPLNTITVEAWVKPSTNTGLGVIIGNYANSNQSSMQFLLRRDNNNYAFWVSGNPGVFKVVNATNAVAINAWQHVAGVWNGSDLKIYVNGVLMGTTTGVTESSFATTTNTTMIGNNQAGTGAERFTGSIDEVRIWNFARTIEQINGSKNCELQGSQSGLIAYYNFNQGVDAGNNAGVTTLNAVTGPNGTLTNFTLNGTTSNWLAGSPVTTGSIVPSVATVTTPVVYTQGDTATPLTATIGANGTGLMWYASATGGTGSATAPTPSTATVGSTSYWVSSTNANGCESERTVIVVTINVINDECSNATGLTVGTTSFNDFPANVSLTGATNSGNPTPTCGNFQGGDVWYTATVPASGNIVIETNGVGNYDSGLEVYTGSCGVLSMVSCDDNSGDGNYSKIVLLGQTPGTVLRIRVWENFFGISNAQFQVSAYDYVVPATHLNFDGVNDFVVSTNAITNNTENQTYQAWFRIPSIPANSDRILQRGNDGTGGWSLQIDVNAAGRLSAGISASPDTFITGTTVLMPNTWYHATFVFENNNSLRLYLNGNLEASIAIGNRTLRNSDNRLRIGTGNLASEHFNGDIDEVRVWNKVLNTTDILNTMNCELQASETGLVAYYKFNQGNDSVSNSTVNSLLDSSSNANNGTLTGFALTGATSNWRLGSTITTGNTCATLGNSDFDNVTRITIYPNPSTGVFNFVSQQNVSVLIYDLLGKLVYNQSLVNGTNSIDISNFNAGVYLLKATDVNGNTETHKLIKN